jgi:hypothetical protein
MEFHDNHSMPSLQYTDPAPQQHTSSDSSMAAYGRQPYIKKIYASATADAAADAAADTETLAGGAQTPQGVLVGCAPPTKSVLITELQQKLLAIQQQIVEYEQTLATQQRITANPPEIDASVDGAVAHVRSTTVDADVTIPLLAATIDTTKGEEDAQLPIKRAMWSQDDFIPL